MTRFLLTAIFLLTFSLASSPVLANDDQEEKQEQNDHSSDDAGHSEEADDHGEEAGEHGEEEKYDPVGTVVEHIADANEFHIWKGVHMPLPCILYAPGEGWTFFWTSKLEHGHTCGRSLCLESWPYQSRG
jgi:hypothetical protein